MNPQSVYLELFRQALRIRLVEEKIIELYPTDKIQSPIHLSIGQEAVAVGICKSLKESDLLFGSYRGHAFYLAKGGGLKQMFAELFGKLTGCAKGKGGSMHLAAKEAGFMGTSAVVASTVPHAVGAALAARLLRKEQIIVSVFGDGATDEGVYHESLNFAALLKLPVIFVCENNGFAVHSRLKDRQSYRIAGHAAAYGIPVIRIEKGYDFVEIHKVFSEVATRVRQEKSPCFVEILTYRFREHVGPGEDFDAGYRSREEFEVWRAKDPLVCDVENSNRFRLEILREIDEAIAFAEQSPFPDESVLFSDVL